MAKSLVEVKIDDAKLRRVQKMLRDIPRGMPKVMSRAINRTATSARAEIVRRVANEVKLTQKSVRKSITLQKATFSRWQANINIYGRRIPLIRFAARQTKAGVSYQIDKTSGRQQIRSAFVTTMKSGHIGVFRRITKRRLPIVQLFGPSVGAVFEQAGMIASEVEKSAYKKLKANIDAQIKYLLSKRATA